MAGSSSNQPSINQPSINQPSITFANENINSQAELNRLSRMIRQVNVYQPTEKLTYIFQLENIIVSSVYKFFFQFSFNLDELTPYLSSTIIHKYQSSILNNNQIKIRYLKDKAIQISKKIMENSPLDSIEYSLLLDLLFDGEQHLNKLKEMLSILRERGHIVYLMYMDKIFQQSISRNNPTISNNNRVIKSYNENNRPPPAKTIEYMDVAIGIIYSFLTYFEMDQFFDGVYHNEYFYEIRNYKLYRNSNIIIISNSQLFYNTLANHLHQYTSTRIIPRKKDDLLYFNLPTNGIVRVNLINGLVCISYYIPRYRNILTIMDMRMLINLTDNPLIQILFDRRHLTYPFVNLGGGGSRRVPKYKKITKKKSITKKKKSLKKK